VGRQCRVGSEFLCRQCAAFCLHCYRWWRGWALWAGVAAAVTARAGALLRLDAAVVGCRFGRAAVAVLRRGLCGGMRRWAWVCIKVFEGVQRAALAGFRRCRGISTAPVHWTEVARRCRVALCALVLTQRLGFRGRHSSLYMWPVKIDR
jgi:hypothetical protein